MIDTLRLHSGEGRFRIQAVVALCGSDVIVIVGGGEKPHVGSVALATSYPSLKDLSVFTSSASVLTVQGHKEDQLARNASLRLSRFLGRTVVVSVGIHIDDASKEDIDLLVETFEVLIIQAEEKLKERLGNSDIKEQVHHPNS